MSARPSWWRRLLARPLEYVTLRGALSFAQDFPDERRIALTRAAQEAWQKRDAAETLLSRGSFAEAAGLASECAKRVTECLQAVAGSSPVATRRVRRATDDLDWACSKLTPAPTLEGQVTRAQKRALRTLLAAKLSLRIPVTEALLGPRSLRRLRWQRAVVALAIVLSPLMALVFVRRSFLGLTARAGSVLDNQFTADRVLDGDPNTEWAANGEEWVLGSASGPARSTPCASSPAIPCPTAPSRTCTSTSTTTRSPTPRRPGRSNNSTRRSGRFYDVGGVTCDRIRIVVTEHYGASAAIAEVEVE